MAGLLDDLVSDPGFQLGLGLLAAGGPGQGSTGQRIAGALQGWQQQQAALQQNKLRAGLLQSQMDENTSQAKYRDAQIAKLTADAAEVQRMQRFAFPGLYGAAGQPTGGQGADSAAAVSPNAASVSGASAPSAGFNIADMSPEQVAVADKLGYKAMADLWKFQNSPQSVAANSFFRVGSGPLQYAPDVKSGLNFDPRTGRTSVLDGADQALARLTQAQEEAKALVADPRERVKLKRADGSEYEISRADFLRMQGGAQGGSQGAGYTGNPMIDAVMHTESRGNPGAVSSAGASGTMQTMPGTLGSPGFGVAPARDGSPAEKQRVGVDYWNAMVDRYKDPALAAVAYNWGPGNADMWLKSGGDFRKLPKETQDYVGQVMLRNGINATRGAAPTAQAPGLPVGAIQTELSAAQQIANEAARVRAVEQAKADVEKGVKAPKEELRRKAGVEQADRMILKVDQALSKVGGMSAGGGAGLSIVPGTTARNLEADLQTIKANLGFAELQAMRDASPTGGALGSVAQQELAALQSTVASLDQSQSPQQLRRNLNEVKTRYQNWKRTVEQAGAQGQPTGAEPATSNGAKSFKEYGYGSADEAIRAAQNAIMRGKDPAAVWARVREMGLQPPGGGAQGGW